MGRREVGRENIRKIQTTGDEGDSYMLTIPKEFINSLGWRDSQKVEVSLEGKTLTIKDWKE